ncbi:PAS domain-containing sensor histidine kinase [Panacagrimonas sp.]|uniref:PAS domain-containing sensor histidine kinase n=1 Tax=Panacagrimonas sp. TaxID=2480088 RepID=UPI003B51B7D2
MGRPLTDSAALQADTDRLIYEQVFDNALVGICFMHERRFLRVNARMEEMLGYGPGELTGQSVRMVYARQEDFEEVGRVVQDFPRDNRYVHERPLVTRHGSLLWGLIAGRKIDPADPNSPSVWVVQDMSASRHAEDQLARANQRLEQIVQSRTLNLQKTNAALKLEVERRRDTERAMIESREKYRVLIRNIPLGIVITDAAGDFVEINPAMQEFFGAADLAGFDTLSRRTPCTVLRDGAVLSLRELIGTCSPSVTRRVEHLTVRWTQASGKPLWFDVIGVRVPVRDLGCAIVFLDRTEQRRARAREHSQQQQLAHATRLSMMGQFASALAHELGQPLNACISYAAGIEHRLGPELRTRPDAQEALSRIQLHLHQAGDVVRNVRAFIARHRPGNEEIDLDALVHATLELLQLQLRENGAVVRIAVDPDLPKLQGTRVELQQVLVNLILNAVEAMRGTGTRTPRIDLRVTRAARRRVRIQVSDNGPGVPPSLHESIFQPYTTTKSGGLGMGLMMCRTIVESHGGELELDNRRKRGASFRVTLPTALPAC